MKEKFKMLSTSILVMLMVFLIPQMVFASTEIPTQTSEFYINDFADVLTDEEEKIMLHNAEALEDEYEGTQIVVTTVPNTGDMEADDYSFEMYDKYKIGKDSMGILILFSNGEGTDHRSIYVATGKGMEAYITDSRAGKFIDKYAMPYFEKEEYSDGLIALQTELIKEVKLQLANENGGNAKNTSNLSTEFIVEVLIIIGGIAAILAIIFLVINKIKKRKAQIDFLERKIERLTENSRNADIFFEQEREALNRKIFMLQEELDKESTKCNYMNEQLEKLQDRYQRAEKLYPGLDEAISNMIEQEFVARCKSEASEVEQQIEVALKEEPSYGNEMFFKSICNLYDALNPKAKEFVKENITAIHEKYEIAVRLREKHEKEIEEQRARAEAKEVETRISSKISRMSSADMGDLESLEGLRRLYRRMSNNAKNYFDAPLLAKLKKLIDEAEEDKKRKEEERRREEETIYMSSSFDSSFDSGSSLNSGFDGDSSGGGAGRDF